MTNSIASAKCPSVLSSGNYGMSQNRCTDESKEYIFLKLTDSAYRAIEEYQRNDHAKRFNNGQCAKIQFNGNSGFIHFPTPDDTDGRKFGFSVNDVEGSLECIQQTRNELDILGSLSYRVQIQAKDDVYDTTRTKMAIAEETEKSKRIREIKQTDISGRKVKKAVSTTFHHHQQQQQQQQQQQLQQSNHLGGNSGNNNNSSSFLSNSNRSKLVSLNNSPPLNGASSSGGGAFGGGASKLVVNSSSSSRSPNPTMLGASGTISSGNNSNRYGSHMSSANLYTQTNASSLPSLTSASSLSSTLAGGITNGYAAASSSHTGSPPGSSGKLSGGKIGNSGNGNGNFLTGSGNARNSGVSGPLSGVKGVLGGNKGGGSGGGGGGSSSTTANPSGGSKLPDISRRKIRERLIHVLALRPFKKPELYNRLQNEGLRERERNLIAGILKDIATTRDQTYNLRRQMWNDVNENWPYYTEQELQQLKRRKPQNLTPPLSSDAGSSTSGQSPTSTHTGSPPPLVNGVMGLKRGNLECGDRFDDTFVSGVPPKKQRISRFNKDVVAGNAPMPTSGPSSGSYGAARIGGGAVYVNANSVGGSGNSGYALQNRNTAYSPHTGGHIGSKTTEENVGNSDLSYGVLDNADDFVPRVEQSSYYGGGASLGRKTTVSEQNVSKTASAPNLKEKRSSSTASDRSSRNNSSNRELIRKSATLSSNSPTPYGGSFVPESNKSNSGRISGGNNANNSGSYQRLSPNYVQQQHKSSSSVIHSPKTHTQASPRESSHGTNRSSSGSGSRSQQALVRSSSKAKLALASAPAPFAQQDHHQQLQSSHHPSQQQLPASSSQVASSFSSHSQYQQQSQAQQHPSPTQQIAAAASSYASAATTSSAEKARYDFSNYTPIKSIEQRRLYKTEFEKDYDEYRELLARIEGVGKRFSILADRLKNVRQGCPDYDRIKQQIVFEYERTSKEESLKRDKQRFDYLHQKLAYIKQLVTDYDKTLTAAAAAAQQHQQQNHQQQQQLPSDADAMETNMLASRSHARLSPMVSGSENSNYSPPISYHHHQKQHFQQHHDAETIHQQPLQLQHYPATQVLPAAAQSDSPSGIEQQFYNGHHHASQANHHQHQSNHNKGNSNNNDSDSDDSSDSNSNDDDDGDNDDDDDDDSNSNSNSNDDDDATSIDM